MNKKAFFKEFEKITALGVILSFVLLLVMGIVIHEELQNSAPYNTLVETENGIKTIRVGKGSKEGRTLFMEYCAACHSNDMISDMTGPALSGVEDRWKNRSDLYRWIQNNQALAAEGNTKAITMRDWASSEMPTFENLDSTAISNILAYIETK